MKKTPGVHKEVTKEPQSTSKELQASFVSVKVRIHDSTIRRRLGKNDIHGRVSRQKLLLTKMNTKICLRFTKKTHLDVPLDFWENILWTNETELKLFKRFESCQIWCNTNSISQKEHLPNSQSWW